MSSLQISLTAVGVVTIGAVLVYNYWTAKKSAPRQAEAPPEGLKIEPVSDSSEPIDPVLTDNYVNLPLPERKIQLDALIDAMATIEVDHPVSGDAALTAMPLTRRVGTKPFHVEGLGEQSGKWEPLAAGRRYTAFQAGVQLANRVGALNNIEFSEFVVKTQAFADVVSGTPSFGDMLQEVARARELDQFASAHDSQLSFTVCARASAWSPGYIQQHAARLGFVAGAIPGRMVLPATVVGLPPVLSLTFDPQAAMAEDPTLSAVREFSLSLDVPQIAREDQVFERLRDIANLLTEHMDGVLTDGEGQILGTLVLDQIALDLQQMYDALDARDLSAGSSLARRLFS